MCPSGTDKHGHGGKERRRFRRRNVVDRQMVTVELGGGRTGILIDLSEAGMAVQPFLPIPSGSQVDFHFDLPRGAGRVSGKGIVQSAVRTGRIGVNFIHLTERSSNHLQHWLAVTRDPFIVPGDAELDNQPDSPAAPISTSHKPSTTRDSDEIDTSTALAMIVERACAVTRADGAALIVAGASGFACRASVGKAPQPGTPASLDSSLTGECLRLGVIVTCTDATTDTRINPMARERLSLRSVVVVPVLIEGRIVGALEVLSCAADAFIEKDVAALEQLADISAGVIASEEATAAALTQN